MKKRIIFLTGLLLALAIPVNVFAEGYTYYMNGQVVDAAQLDWNQDIQVVTGETNGAKRFVHHSQGYSFEIPGHYQVDTSMSDAQTLLYDGRTQVEVYHDNFNGTVHSSTTFTAYNKRVLNDPYLKICSNYTTYKGKVKVNIMSWGRDKLAMVSDDMNYYYMAEFARNSKEVVTVFIKSQDPIAVNDIIFRTFKFENKIGYDGIHKQFKKPAVEYKGELARYYNAVFSPESPQRWGIFYHGATSDMTYLKALEQQVNYQFDVLVRYGTLDVGAPVDELNRAWMDGRVVELTLQTMHMRQDNTGMMYRILNGDYDAYFRQYARDIKTFGKPVLFRLNNEMNGDWCEYSANHYSMDTELYKKMWRYVHGIFEQEGVENALWVWNPHDTTFPDFRWNNALNYFPGEKYVDIVGMTGYNTGTYYQGEKWRSFDEIYPKLVSEYSTWFDYPFMITEFGSNNVGGSKPAWIQDMFSKIPNYNQIKVIIWFNGVDKDPSGNPARTYAIDEDQASIQMFRNHLNGFSSRVVQQLNSTAVTPEKPLYAKPGLE